MDPAVAPLERAAAEHWRAPDQERLGEWLLRAAEGFTGRANSALPLGDPGLPLPDAVTSVTDWYRARGLPPMIVVPVPLPPGEAPPPAEVPPDGSPAHSLDAFLAERAWVLRPGPAFVMTADIDDVPPPAPGTRVRIDAEPDAAWCELFRYRGQPLPPIARALMMSAPWQGFGSVRLGSRAVAVGRVSVADRWGAITAVEVDAAWRRRGLGAAITLALCAEAARHGAQRVLLQVETGNAPARALYAHCGFRDAHRYHYRVAPDAATRGPA